MSVTESTEDMAYEIEEIKDLVPRVLETLKSEDQVKTYRPVAKQSFRLTDIAYLLFLDIIKCFSTETTLQMRYPNAVKSFWRVGLKLFKGKFLGFRVSVSGE